MRVCIIVTLHKSYIRFSNFVRIAAISSFSLRRHFLSRARTSSVVGSSPRLDAMDIAVNFVVALREAPELIIGSYHPLDKRDLLRKLIS